ncbi:hypothetical protein AYI70_g8228 [Smittium culicis]|uniref:Uncharacterized protein n=1 Tax=Smittium culicis TaxID=133412 RepID=A0A1R1XGZ3_9FUNG|nr:hypothetical protein AYI70_g8228 [Smittium culicis]
MVTLKDNLDNKGPDAEGILSKESKLVTNEPSPSLSPTSEFSKLIYTIILSVYDYVELQKFLEASIEVHIS